MTGLGVPEFDAVGVTGLRMVALFSVAPFFGHQVVPVRVRMMLALATASVVSPQLGAGPGAQELGPGLVLGEILIGVTLGFAVRIFFVVFDVLAEAASIQGGLGAAQTIDPANGSSSAALGSIFAMVGIAIWLAIGGHHELLRAVVVSYEVLPIGGGGPSRESLLGMVGLAGPIFELGIRLAGPITVAMMGSNAAVGVLGRTIPQLNLITLQLPAHVAATFLILALGAHGMMDVIAAEMDAWSDRGLTVLAGDR